MKLYFIFSFFQRNYILNKARKKWFEKNYKYTNKVCLPI